jgi:hypothetical protein
MALYNGERVYPELAQFLPVQNGRVPIEVTEGGLWYNLATHQFLAVINGVITPLTTGTSGIGGSIALNQIAVGSGVNTIGGSSALTFNPLINLLTIGDSNQVILSVPASGALSISTSDGTGNGIIALGSGFTTGFSVQRSGGVYTTVINASATGGQFNFNSGSINIAGTTSGNASIGVAPVAGLPAAIYLPTTSGTAGQVLTTDGGNPQQTSWTTPFGTIGGSIASTQVAVGSGANTISGSANLTFASSVLTVNGQLTVTSATTGFAHPATAGIIFDPLSAFPAYMTHDGITGSFTLRMDNQVVNAHGLLSWGASGLFVDGGAGSPGFILYTGAPQAGYVGITNQSAQFDFSGTGLFAVTANPGLGAKGEILLSPITNTITFYGNVSGNAAIGTATAAGTPNKINLPTTTGTSGQVLTTDGANPQQTSWTTVGTTTTIASGSQALGTTLITSGSKSTILTITAAGVLATDNVMLDFNTDPSGITGYAPSATGMLTIIKWCSAGAINIYQYNNTAASITPGAVTVNYRVVR